MICQKKIEKIVEWKTVADAMQSCIDNFTPQPRFTMYNAHEETKKNKNKKTGIAF